MAKMKKMADGGLTDSNAAIGADATTGINKISEGAQALSSSLNQINQAVGTAAPGFQNISNSSASPAGSLSGQLGYKKGGVITTRKISTATKSKKQSSW